MLKAVKDTWQNAFERTLDNAERASVRDFTNYYKTETNKAIGVMLQKNSISEQDLLGIFTLDGFGKLYEGLYERIGMTFANWYAKNFNKYITKGVSANQFQEPWRASFRNQGILVGAQRVTLVQNTAKTTLIKVYKQLANDPVFASEGEVVKGKMLRQQFDRYSKYQAERLVRTEATNAANYATMQSAQDIFPGADMQKEWISANDERTRGWHRISNISEPIVDFDKPFIVMGEELMRPGDPRGSAKNVINCRCSVAPFPKEAAQTIGLIEDIGFGLSGETTDFILSNINLANEIGGAITTIKELEDFSNEYFKKFNPKDKFKTNLEGIDFEVAEKVINQLVDLTKQYKIENFYQIYVDDIGSVAAKVSRIFPSNDTVLIINKNSFKNLNRLNSRTLSSQENNFLAAVDSINLSKSTITHEFSHLFGSSSRKTLQTEEWWSFKNKLSKLFNEYKSLDIRLATDVNFISRYALTNVDEFMAESYSMYMLNSTPSPYAVKVGQLIDEYFKI